MEKFNPNQYKNISELPEEQKSNFKDVEKGFVSAEAISDSEAFDRAIRIRKKLEHKDNRSAWDYEAASLSVDYDMAKEDFRKKFPESKIEKAITEKHNIADAVGSLAWSLAWMEKERIDKKSNLDTYRRVLDCEAYRFLSRDRQKELGQDLEPVLRGGDYMTKVKILKAYEFMGLPKETFERIKSNFIDRGEYNLYIKLSKISGEEINKQELAELGKQALAQGSPFDAIRAFELSGEKDLLAKAKELEKEKTEKAKEKERKMPDGFMTKKLMSHETSLRNLPKILKEGILSIVEMLKRYGEREYGAGCDLQLKWGAFDYISVYDPWCGFGTKPDHAKKGEILEERIWRVVQNYRKKYPIINDAIRMSDSGYFFKIENESISVDPELKEFFEEINGIFEEATEIEEPIAESKPMQYKYDYLKSGSKEVIASKEIDPAGFFVVKSHFEPYVLIDPDRNRFITYHSGYGPESFVKTKILPDEIIGIVIPPVAEEGSVDFEWFLKLAEQNGVPLYIGKANRNDGTEMSDKDFPALYDIIDPERKADNNIKYSCKKLWPK